MKFICPSCKKNIVNRKVNSCLYCGKNLPEELLFSEQQISTFDKARIEREEDIGRFQVLLQRLDDLRRFLW